MRDSFQFGSKVIEYEVSFSDRKTLGITVTPHSEVLVRAPLATHREKIQQVLRKRGAWIIKQQSYFLSFQPRQTERKYVSGETHLYLGRQYRLMIEDGERDSVKLLHGEFRVEATNRAKVRNLMKSWYMKMAREKFEQIASEVLLRFQAEGVSPEALVIREMALRWGSCTPKGKIILNPELIKAPRGCIEYVIIHELCHLVHPDHSPAFFRLQSRYLTDWEKWKEKLERMMA